MKLGLTFSIFLATTSVGLCDNFDFWSEPSPSKALYAVERRIPDPSAPGRLDLDGFAVFICKALLRNDSDVMAGAVVAHRVFPARLVSQIRWSPDSKFLLFTTASSGGHSPWHFKTFLYRASDKTFRDVEGITGGGVIAAEFHFEPPDVAVLTIHDTVAPDTSPKMPSKQVKISLQQDGSSYPTSPMILRGAPNHAIQPTAGRRSAKFSMTRTSPSAAKLALASGG